MDEEIVDGCGCHWLLEKNGYLKPRPDQTQLDGLNDDYARGHLTLPCVRKTGCGTAIAILRSRIAP